ncbi:hypothetical protein FGG78_07565 [Thioclava sp. BHET1]|uniref:17 kDa surface antigen n=1 Tax=Thioclava dalianensis TaxID=1185766 RepID=A0A074TKY8_9RHOB|nr:hypothetical protein [Thioclava dalianensis]KEP70825.1 hypothetical protein DL1_13490 [Thioclava dalianensis]TMV92673.1 hypothetical protein FGG78_07565 [Thioclava sp. BHET1]
MRKTPILILLSGLALAGCMQTDGQRALAGAGAGALVADATDNNVVAGAALGALAGTYCDDAGVCTRSRRGY